jgi:hypothetical protein
MSMNNCWRDLALTIYMQELNFRNYIISTQSWLYMQYEFVRNLLFSDTKCY